MREVLFRPLPQWAQKVLAVPGLLLGCLFGLGFLITLVAALVGSRGLVATGGLLALAGWMLLESVLAFWVAIDFWRGHRDDA